MISEEYHFRNVLHGIYSHFIFAEGRRESRGGTVAALFKEKLA